jgi:hypothetical protein
MAIAGFVLAFLFWPLGLIFSGIAMSETKRTGKGGYGLALAGLILSLLALLIVIIAVAAAG